MLPYGSEDTPRSSWHRVIAFDRFMYLLRLPTRLAGRLIQIPRGGSVSRSAIGFSAGPPSIERGTRGWKLVKLVAFEVNSVP